MSELPEEKPISPLNLLRLQHTTQTTVWGLADELMKIWESLGNGLLSQDEAAKQLTEAANRFRDSWFYTATIDRPTG